MSECAAGYAAKPWLQLYGERPAAVQAGRLDMLTIFRSAHQRDPDAEALHYFDRRYSYAWLDQQSDALAAWLAEEGAVLRGDRVAIILQNVPQFAVAALAAWKLGAVPMPSNPMYREAELKKLLADGTPRVVICHDDHHAVVTAALASVQMTASARLLTVSAWHLQQRNDTRILPPRMSAPCAADDFSAALAACGGQRPPKIALHPGEAGLLLYTSGTTGVPKGVVLSHGSLAFNAEISQIWFGMRDRARVLAVAPLFHITGFETALCAAFYTAGCMILTYRFEPRVALDAMVEHAPTVAVAAITAYIALMNAPTAKRAHFDSFDLLFSGGAPIPPSVVDQFEISFGRRIRSCYGMTETCAPSHVSPSDVAPTDPVSGAISVGVPVSNVEARIIDDDGMPVPIGEAGELVVRGPMIMDCYFNKPQETATALRDGWMHTGDIGFMDHDGWFYLIDRKKDMIIASGFKVWPREVEDVLYKHPAVREAAVVGIPDEYRGETVKAYVSLVSGAEATPQQLAEHCKRELAAYKAPKVVEILPELPKTATGKIMRSAVRDAHR